MVRMSNLSEKEGSCPKTPNYTGDRYPNNVIFPPLVEEFVDESRFDTLSSGLRSLVSYLKNFPVDGYHFLKFVSTKL